MSAKIAIITGASQGIGRAIAIKFASEGLQTVLTGRNSELLEETAAIIKAQGQLTPFIIRADLIDVKTPQIIVRQTLAEFKQIDVLVNNAGVMYLRPFTELSFAEFNEMMRVNMAAVFQLTQETVREMMERQEGGAIINIASLAGKNGFKSGTGYAASKWALRGFANCLFEEVRNHDIRVTTIFPGSVATNLNVTGANPTGTLAKNKMQASDIAEAAYLALKMPARTMVSEIDLRPTNPKKSI